MADEIVGIKVKVDGSEAVESTKSLRAQLKEAVADVAALSDKFGVSNKATVEAAKRAAELKDRIGDAKTLIDAFNPDAKFKAFSASLSGVAGGFAAVQGAMALFGSESDNVQKALLKVQAAMALSQGLQAVGESIDSFKELGSVIANSTTLQKANSMATAAAAAVQRAFTGAVNETSTGFKVLKGAIAATGIGLVLVALGTIVAYWDDIKASIDGVSSEQKQLNIDVEKNLKAEQEKLEAIDSQSNQLRLQGKSEKEILQIKINQTNEAISAAEISLASAKATRDAQIAAAKRNQDILLGIMKFLSTPIRSLLEVIDNVGAAMGKQFGLLKSFDLRKDLVDKSLVNYLFDPKETAEKGNETVSAAEKLLNTLKEKRAGYLLETKKIDKNAQKGDDKDAKDREAAELDAQRKLQKLKDDAEVAGIEDQYKARKVAIDKATAEEIAQVNANEKLKQETKDALIKALNDKSNADKAKIDREQKDEQDKKDKEDLKKRLADERQIRELDLQGKIELLDKENAENDIDFEKDLERLATKDKLLQQQMNIELENTELTEFQKTEIRKKYADARAKVADDEVAVEKAAQQAKIELNNKYLDLYAQFGGLLTQIAGKSKAVAIAGLVIEKGAAIAKIITQMNTVPAILPPGIPNPAYIPARIGGALSIASVIAASAQGIQQINSSGIPGGSGSAGSGGGGNVSAGGAAPIAPAAPIQNTVTQLSPNSINQLGSATNRAYIVESDVTNSQDRIKRINRAARLT